MFLNATSFAAEAVPFFDERGVEAVLVLAKGTFQKRGQRIFLADEQAPVRLADVPESPSAVESGRDSSLRYASDVTGQKPGADVIVIGNAISAKPVPRMDVAVRAPGRSVTLRVHGERVYYRSAFGLKMGPSAPFERSPITYERAYGGKSRDGALVDWRNPAGRGVHRSAAELEDEKAPCIEDPANPVEPGKEGTPVGLSPIASWWLPRRALSGTMDAAWQAGRMPLPPLDFDLRFNQVASPQLQLDRPLQEGDTIATHGLSEDRLFEISIPSLRVIARCRFSGSSSRTLPLVLDTALLEPERAQVELTLRRVVPLGRGATLLREVRLDVDA